MSTVTLDHATREKLNGMNVDLELVDEAGDLLGHFVPPERYRKLLYAWAEAQCPYTQEELERMSEEKGGRTLSEIWKDLGVQ